MVVSFQLPVNGSRIIQIAVAECSEINLSLWLTGVFATKETPILPFGTSPAHGRRTQERLRLAKRDKLDPKLESVLLCF